ncbi:DUF5655 domain-containing protein [Candidatus Nitrosacidococcus sp. I8]|uniref:DUF5655 domain-containing protein n=1 Tax=Candidatus Nitrosacidococcus sp. I8 TaxID=2942908 RepID=UPI002226E4EC|nr:DUF5655 domain-containing protein [Candidatus Nitrosacidococcus sp. I8]CAH9018673.1 hypothetical protein NURINAE_01066 [Candidatus Nitrosacidococcus sp. I8]
MALFNINHTKLDQIKEDPFKLEKEIQEITEQNLEIIFRFYFVRSEFSLHNFRIDTLAFDKKSTCFVIIEYKRDKNFSVIDQGYTYLSLMLNNKADFILEYNERCKGTLRKDDIDWSQSKVIFVSPSFTPYQKEAINFKDLPIELWEIKRYDNNTVRYRQLPSYGAQESIKTISNRNDTTNIVAQEIKVYTEEEHLAKATEEIKELYRKIKEAILYLDSLEVKARKKYIAFLNPANLVDIQIRESSLVIWINLSIGRLDDPKGLCRNVSNKGHHGNGDYELQIKNDDDLEYIMSLVKQAIKN